jgi:hypothetical protein
MVGIAKLAGAAALENVGGRMVTLAMVCSLIVTICDSAEVDYILQVKGCRWDGAIGVSVCCALVGHQRRLTAKGSGQGVYQ